MPSYERNKKYAAAYRAKIERIDVFVPQGQKQIIKNHAAERGESMNEFINRAINATMQREGKIKESPLTTIPE